MAEQPQETALPIERPVVLDLLDTSGAPALSSTSDIPIVETKPDAQNEGKPPDVAQAAPLEAEEAEGEAELKEESATSPEDSTSANDQPKKSARGVQKRLDELTKQAADERARAQAAEERLDKFLNSLESAVGKQQEPEPVQNVDLEPTRPNRNDYADPESWETAMLDYSKNYAQWSTRQQLSLWETEQRKQAELRTIEEGHRKAHEVYTERIAKAQEKYADFKEVAQRPDVIVSAPLAVLIHQSEMAPDIQYYLGSHPEEAARIYQLPVPLQIKELGKIELRLTEAPAPKPAISKAPRPIQPLEAKSGSITKSPHEMSMDEYASYRKQQEREARRH